MLNFLLSLVVLIIWQNSCLTIYVPNDNTNRKTWTSVGIKSLGWQDPHDQNQLVVHHNYSKVLNQNENISQPSVITYKQLPHLLTLAMLKNISGRSSTNNFGNEDGATSETRNSNFWTKGHRSTGDSDNKSDETESTELTPSEDYLETIENEYDSTMGQAEEIDLSDTTRSYVNVPSQELLPPKPTNRGLPSGSSHVHAPSQDLLPPKTDYDFSSVRPYFSSSGKIPSSDHLTPETTNRRTNIYYGSNPTQLPGSSYTPGFQTIRTPSRDILSPKQKTRESPHLTNIDVPSQNLLPPRNDYESGSIKHSEEPYLPNSQFNIPSREKNRGSPSSPSFVSVDRPSPDLLPPKNDNEFNSSSLNIPSRNLLIQRNTNRQPKLYYGLNPTEIPYSPYPSNLQTVRIPSQNFLPPPDSSYFAKVNVPSQDLLPPENVYESGSENPYLTSSSFVPSVRSPSQTLLPPNRKSKQFAVINVPSQELLPPRSINRQQKNSTNSENPLQEIESSHRRDLSYFPATSYGDVPSYNWKATDPKVINSINQHCNNGQCNSRTASKGVASQHCSSGNCAVPEKIHEVMEAENQNQHLSTTFEEELKKEVVPPDEEAEIQVSGTSIYETSIKKSPVAYEKCPKMATGQFVYAHSCNQFLNCWKGRGMVQNCAPGTMFNPKTLECDYAHKVKCITGPRTAVEEGTRTGKAKGLHFRCPSDFSGLIPHHDNCSKFVRCSNRIEKTEECRQGTLFSVKINNCDHVNNAECASWTKYPNVQHNKHRNEKGSLKLLGYRRPFIYKSHMELPQPVVKKTCNQYPCFGSENQQPTSLVRNQYYTSQFHRGSRTQGNHNEGSGSSSWKPTTYHGAGSSHQIEPSSVSDPKCPDGASGVHPHPFDCSKFLNCANGITFIQDCGPGTLFNPVIKVCDYPYNVHCTNSDQSATRIDSASTQNWQEVINAEDWSDDCQNSGGKCNFNNGRFSNRDSQTGNHHQEQPGEQQTITRQHGGFYDRKPQTSNVYQKQPSTSETNGKIPGYFDKNSGQYVTLHRDLQPPVTDSNSQNGQEEYYSSSQKHHWQIPFDQTSTSKIPLEPLPLGPLGKNERASCSGDFYFCTSEEKCIPNSMVCDGRKDCEDESDETNCDRYLEQFEMTPNAKLGVHYQEKYDNISLPRCAKICTEMEGFSCKSFCHRQNSGGACLLMDTNIALSGALIPSSTFNYYESKQHVVDCSNKYICKNQKCIEPTQICDGVNDCGGREDEKGCSKEDLQYEIRLAGSEKPYEGRVEIKVFGKWGYICDDQFGLRDADVVCNELGFDMGALEVKGNSYFAQDIENNETFYLMDDVSCLGNETSLRDCNFNGWGIHNCEAQEIVGLVCKTPQEKCSEDFWKCSTGQDCIPLTFLCDGVFDCKDQSDENTETCKAPVELRLAGGRSNREGRLEIKYHGVWGTVCDDDFNDDAAKVVCKSLGYFGRAGAAKDGYFGPGEGPIWLDQVFCQGNESRVEDCEHWSWGEHNCEHSEDVGVICNSYDISGDERSAKFNDDNLGNYLSEKALPKRCGYRNDDIFLENDSIHERVVQGSKARRGDYPWQASIKVKHLLKSSHWCGAVVISSKFVLTAAHCLDGYQKGSYFVSAGDYNADFDEGTEQEAFIEEYYVHDLFRKGGKMNNDIALVKLKGDGFVLTKDVQPICLPERDAEYIPWMNCTISGFGSTKSGKSAYSRNLMAAWVPIQPVSVCKMPHVYGTAITDGMVCAGYLDEGMDACDGDSGGPLACLHEGYFSLYGITSWGQRCGHANKPGVYVKVAHYRDWIEKTMEKHSRN